MPATLIPDWRPHPNTALEKAIQNADSGSLHELLLQPMVQADRYAYLRVLDRLHRLQPGNPQVLASWMQAMLISNRPAPVWAVAEHWPIQGVIDPALALIAAQVAQVMGRTEDARTRYRALIERHPEWADAWQKYLDFEKPGFVEARHLACVEALRTETETPYTREKAAFGLASYHAHESPGHAFVLASEAHALKRRRLGAWDSVTLTQRLDADRQRKAAPSDSTPGPVPLFVVGLPRSGTTLLTRLLGSHTSIEGLGEQNLIPSLAQTACREPRNSDPRLSTYVQSWFRAATGDLAADAQVVVDKLPANVEHMGLILSMFPDARIIHLERELADCAMSIHLKDFDFGCRYTDTAEDLAVYAKSVGAHARFWTSAAEGRVWSLRYEALVEDPRKTLTPVLASMGLLWENGMLDFWRQREQIGTFSEAQVRRPIHQGSIGSAQRFLPQAADYLRALTLKP